MRLKPEKLDLSRMLAEVAELYQYVAEEKSVSISVNGSPDMVITADRNRMRQVFTNLMDNAIKYNSHGGQVIVTARQEPTRTVVTFEDTGMSIAPEDLERAHPPAVPLLPEHIVGQRQRAHFGSGHSSIIDQLQREIQHPRVVARVVDAPVRSLVGHVLGLDVVALAHLDRIELQLVRNDVDHALGEPEVLHA